MILFVLKKTRMIVTSAWEEEYVYLGITVVVLQISQEVIVNLMPVMESFSIARVCVADTDVVMVQTIAHVRMDMKDKIVSFSIVLILIIAQMEMGIV
jgi:hypothetical protein